MLYCKSDKPEMLQSIQENVLDATQRLILCYRLEHTWILHKHSGAWINLLGYHGKVTILAYFLSPLHDPTAANSVTAARKAKPRSAEEISTDWPSSNFRASFPSPFKFTGSILDL